MLMKEKVLWLIRFTSLSEKMSGVSTKEWFDRSYSFFSFLSGRIRLFSFLVPNLGRRNRLGWIFSRLTIHDKWWEDEWKLFSCTILFHGKDTWVWGKRGSKAVTCEFQKVLIFVWEVFFLFFFLSWFFSFQKVFFSFFLNFFLLFFLASLQILS